MEAFNKMVRTWELRHRCFRVCHLYVRFGRDAQCGGRSLAFSLSISVVPCVAILYMVRMAMICIPLAVGYHVSGVEQRLVGGENLYKHGQRREPWRIAVIAHACQ
jgi:hypothetical protein